MTKLKTLKELKLCDECEHKTSASLLHFKKLLEEKKVCSVHEDHTGNDWWSESECAEGNAMVKWFIEAFLDVQPKYFEGEKKE